MRAVIDRDVLIDYLQGLRPAKVELDRYERREMSIISWMEVMSGADSAEEAAACRQFLETFTVHPVSAAVAEEAVRLRAAFRIRLPDAIVWATARSEGCLLVTRNARDFPPTEPGVRIPYAV